MPASKFDRPIFVIGCCNSGTTILWNLIKSHKDVSGPTVEGQDLAEMPMEMRHYLGPCTFRMWAHHLFQQGDDNGIFGSNLEYYVTENDITSESTRAIYAAYGPFIDDSTKLCDKSPAHTLRARFLQGVFPGSRFVAIVRNGYACAQSICDLRDNDSARPEFKGLKTHIWDAAIQWENANRIITSYDEQNLLENLLIVSYEELVHRTGEVTEEILEFCELSKKGMGVIPEFETDRNKRRLEYLGVDSVEDINRVAGGMLQHYGYEIIPKHDRDYSWLEGV